MNICRETNAEMLKLIGRRLRGHLADAGSAPLSERLFHALFLVECAEQID
jgi:hypothetical protein